jgi:parvulin-like peptidyl-prolyl isomerase
MNLITPQTIGRRLRPAILLTLLLAGTLFPAGRVQDEVPALATIGEEQILAEEFQSRLQHFLTLTSVKDNLQVREAILNNMIHERLILQEARRLGWLHLVDYQRSHRMAELHALLDAYKRFAVIDKVVVEDQELIKAFARLNEYVKARHLYARTEQEAWELFALLQHGATFEELAQQVFQDSRLRESGGSLGYFTYGEMDPALEEVAYRLPIGEISEPIKTELGYSILRVEERIRRPIATEYEFLQRKRHLTRVIRALKIDVQSKQLVEQIRKELAPVFDDATLESLLMNWRALVNAAELMQVPNFSASPILAVSLERTVVSFHEGSWTLRELLEWMSMTTERQQQQVTDTQRLKQYITGLLVRNELVKRAKEKMLDRDEEVQRHIREAAKLFLLEKWRSYVTGDVQITAQAMRQWYQWRSQPFYTPECWDVSEIAVNSHIEAEKIMKELRRGTSFEDMARQYSVRPGAAETGGRFGYLTRRSLGSLAEPVAKAKKGEILGPFAFDSFTSVIRINDYRAARPKSFEEAQGEIRLQMEWQVKQKAFFESLDRLKQDVPVTINRQLLTSLRSISYR